ncbi:cysteine hydrolase [Sphingobacterium sp. SRCM116780]|nr:cysteine hydrolase [Sphingobacterium sp. SRCM116780]
MQKGSFTADTPRYDEKAVINKINTLASAIRSDGGQVIFVQHDGTKEDKFYPGSWEWEILEELHVAPQDQLLNKTANDSFYRTELQSVLEKLRVKELIITGCATDYCVDTTVRTALNHDYAVTVVKDAHTTADRPHLSAKQVIVHHNWMWENMTPTEGQIRLLDCDELLTELA